MKRKRAPPPTTTKQPNTTTHNTQPPPVRRKKRKRLLETQTRSRFGFFSTPEPRYDEIMPLQPLTTVFVGVNPSETSWKTGFPYASPSNRFWKLMQAGGMWDSGRPTSRKDVEEGAVVRGMGFTDVALTYPTSTASKVPKQAMDPESDHPIYGPGLFLRLQNHVETVAAAHGCSLESACPARIAFVGVTHFRNLASPPLKGKIGFGKTILRPPQWPDVLAPAEVWILPSPSGRAVMSTKDRTAPYVSLGVSSGEGQER